MAGRQTGKVFKTTVCAVCVIGVACCYLAVGSLQDVAGAVGENRGQVEKGQEGSIVVRPFVMERWLMSYTRDQKGELIWKEFLGRRSDGTLCLKMVPVLGRPGETTVRHVTLPDGRFYDICDEKQIRTIKVLTGTDLAAYQRLITPSKRARAKILGLPPPSAADEGQSGETNETNRKRSCGHWFERKVGYEVVDGYPVQIWQRESMGANQFLVRLSTYRMPRFGCLPLINVFEEQGPDRSYTRRWEILLRYINEAEPLAEDLDLGEWYSEVTQQEFKELAGWRPEDMYNLVTCGCLDCQDSVSPERPVSGKPDFNGRWVLDLEESHGPNGERLPYRAFSLVVAHNEPSLDIIHEITKNKKNHRLMRFALTTDGTPETPENWPMRTAWAWWEGETLVYRYETIQRNERGPIQVERWMRLSEDGLSMYAETLATDQNGLHNVTGTEVWHRKQGPKLDQNVWPPQTTGR